MRSSRPAPERKGRAGPSGPDPIVAGSALRRRTRSDDAGGSVPAYPMQRA